MSDSDTLDRTSFANWDKNLAGSFLREASIGRQQQAGSLDPSDVEAIRSGSMDHKIGFDDAVFALTNAETIGQKAQQSLGMSQGGQT